MKILVFVLALANLLFFAYTEGYFGHPENPDAGRMEQQVNPESIHLVARGEVTDGKKEAKKEVTPQETPPGKEATAPEKEPAIQKSAPPVVAEKTEKLDKPEKPLPSPQICMAWGELSGAEANRLAGLLVDKFTDFKVERRATPSEGSGWWVFIPPLSSKADVDRKVSELKHMGVSDYFVVQDTGPNHFAISLGVFSNEAGANDQLANLKAKGVKSAKVGPRIGKDALHAVEARGPASRKPGVLAAVSGALPGITSQICR